MSVDLKLSEGNEFSSSLQVVALERSQRTLLTEVSYSGIGVHSGKQVNLNLVPAKPGTGIVFRRVDLPGKPEIPASVEYVQDTLRCTTIGVGTTQVQTIEHVVAALTANQIDNVYVDVDAEEPPIGNGSSDVFVDLIEQAGSKEQDSKIQVLKLLEPVYFSDNDIHIVALPYDGYRISYTLSYPKSEALKNQYQSIEINKETFNEELAPCRTFALYEEISLLIDHGLIKGGSLENAVVIKDDVVFSKDGLFFPDEMVRHKILDMVGDLKLVGFDFHAHIIAVKAGHTSNFAFAKKLLRYFTKGKN